MKKVSLIFVGVAVFCFFWADLDVLSGNSHAELGRIGLGLVTPDVTTIARHADTLLNTILFAVCGLTFGVVIGFALSFHYHRRWVRLPLSFIRSIHEIFWVLLLMTPFGLNHVTAILGIGLPYTGVMAKMYAEIIEESDKRPSASLPHGSGKIVTFLYGVLPVIRDGLNSYTAYRFECALRSSAVIGFVGFPTLGFHLESYFSEGYYSQAAALFYALLVLIGSRKIWLHRKAIPVLVPVCFLLVSWEMRLSWNNTSRLLFEMVPFPIRTAVGEGHPIQWHQVGKWFQFIWSNQAAPGLWNTLIVTQLALVATGLFALMVFPFNGRHFFSTKMRTGARFTLIFLRTIPEYILAFVLILPLGPSMLPAILTIGLHNGAIVAHLISAHANKMDLNFGAVKRKTDRYFYEVVPRVYGQFLSFVFYRWEIIVRESAMLGVLGITTIGFYIDSAISDDRMDRAWLLICMTALLNMGIDSLSVVIRKKLKITGQMSTL